MRGSYLDYAQLEIADDIIQVRFRFENPPMKVR